MGIPASRSEDKCPQDALFVMNNARHGKRSDLVVIRDKIKGGASKRQIMDEHPDACTRYNRMYEQVRKIYFPSLTKPTFMGEPRWPMITDWSKSHIVVGPSGIGKTEWAKQHFPDGCLFVSTMDDLVDFDPQVHQGIIFNNMSFKHLPRTAQHHLVDQDNDRSIRIRYVDARIPANTKKIFTTNVVDIFTSDPAIDRRVWTHYLSNV